MTWRAQITGEKHDLEALSKSFTDTDLRLVAEDDKYFLESKQFESTSDSDEVLKMTEDFLAVLNGVARLAYRSRTPLTFYGLTRILPNGVKCHFVTLIESHVFRDTINMTVITAEGGEVTIDPIDPALSWVRIASQDKAVTKALRLFGNDANDWVGIYRLLEVIEQDVGGSAQIVAAGWATNNSLTLFGRTACSVAAVGDLARHGKETTQPPKTPMNLPEARALIEMILHSWLRTKGEPA